MPDKVKETPTERGRRYRLNKEKKYPWLKHYYAAYTRCTYPYGKYFQKGIKLEMNKEDFKKIWFRDKAWLLKEPSIDRINDKIGYIKNNCRFIEKKENSRLGNIGRIPTPEARANLSKAIYKFWERRKKTATPTTKGGGNERMDVIYVSIRFRVG